MKQVTTATGFVQIVALVLFSLVAFSQAQVPGFGRCPKNVQTVEDLDVNAYLGQWYEYSKYPVIFEANGKCIYALYGLDSDGDVSVYNFNIDRRTQAPMGINGTAKIVSPGKLAVTFQNIPSFAGSSNYWVLGTDYNNYTVVYSCSEFLGFMHTKVVWILTRERVPSEATIETATGVITANGLSLRPLEKTDQQNCPETQLN